MGKGAGRALRPPAARQHGRSAAADAARVAPRPDAQGRALRAREALLEGRRDVAPHPRVPADLAASDGAIARRDVVRGHARDPQLAARPLQARARGRAGRRVSHLRVAAQRRRSRLCARRAEAHLRPARAAQDRLLALAAIPKGEAAPARRGQAATAPPPPDDDGIGRVPVTPHEGGRRGRAERRTRRRLRGGATGRARAVERRRVARRGRNGRPARARGREARGLQLARRTPSPTEQETLSHAHPSALPLPSCLFTISGSLPRGAGLLALPRRAHVALEPHGRARGGDARRARRQDALRAAARARLDAPLARGLF